MKREQDPAEAPAAGKGPRRALCGMQVAALGCGLRAAAECAIICRGGGSGSRPEPQIHNEKIQKLFKFVTEFYYGRFSRQFWHLKRAHSCSYVTDEKDKNGRKDVVRKERS